MPNSDVLEALTSLLETCRDAERGFRTAADVVADSALKRLFSAYAHQRAEFARELEGELVRLGGTPPRHGTLAGALHRALMNVRAAIDSREERSVMDEAERGEDAAIAAYAEALQIASLPADLRAVIDRQAARVRETHDRLRDLKRAA
jgi:uncharacterized protein (TIGR02284 family)